MSDTTSLQTVQNGHCKQIKTSVHHDVLAPHATAELYQQLPDKFDDMSKTKWGESMRVWKGEGKAENHITAESAGASLSSLRAARPRPRRRGIATTLD